MKKILALILALMLTVCAALAEETADTAAEEDKVVVTVNGEAIYQSELESMVSSLTSVAEDEGYDTTDETVLATINEEALTDLIKDRVITQDMTAQGCYEFTDDEQEQVEYAAQLTLASFIEQYAAYFEQYYGDSVDLGTYTYEDLAEGYLTSAGYTLSYLENYYTNALASEKYSNLLVTVTDDEVTAEYEARVADSKEKYGTDIEAFETALYNSSEVWYRPDGYRAILQIMMTAEGETDEEKLASVSDKTNDIYARLGNGESFEDMIRLYGEDTAFDTESFFETGYQVHQDSVLWEDAFVDASMALENIGAYSDPYVFGDNVCILYYLKDVPGGAVELTDALKDALKDDLLTEKSTAAVAARAEELMAAADIRYADAQ